MSAFLPRLATPMQQLLADQLRDGAVSRLLLVGIDGGTPRRARGGEPCARPRARGAAGVRLRRQRRRAARRARSRPAVHASLRAVAARWRPNGSPRPDSRRRCARRTTSSPHPRAALVRRYVPADPTGELLALLAALQGERQPARHDGVWMSRDGATALALVQVAAAGYDIDAQARNLALIDAAFAGARDAAGAPAPAPHRHRPRGVRRAVARRHPRRRRAAVADRVARRRGDAVRGLPLAAAAGARASCRSPPARSPASPRSRSRFGTVHGITLGFGLTLIGEAVDYAIYVFARRDAPLARADLARRCGSAPCSPPRASAPCCSRDSRASRSSVSSPSPASRSRWA